jgi:AbrB family looped-hinge helix DNA binding protein
MTILTPTDRGVLTLPAKLRKALGIRPGQPLIAEATPEGLLLRPAVTLPVEIYTDERIREFAAEEAKLAAALARRKKPVGPSSTARPKRARRRKPAAR